MSKAKNNGMLLLAALIWGCAFVAQSVGMDYVGPITFNCLRSLIGAATLFPFILYRNHKEKPEQKEDRKVLWKGGILCGIVLCAASMFQQYGLQETTVGKAGFITALYVIMVPLFGLLLHKKVRPLIWLCAGMSVIGLYFLSMQGSFSLSSGDLLILICAILFAVHILVIDHFAPYTDCVKMSCIQFLTAGVLSFVPMMLLEHPTWSAISAGAVPILYAGVMSSGVAYTLQVLGQKNADPAVASMILSLESVFSALAGWIILHQALSPREIFGSCLMFGAILLSQIPSQAGEIVRKKQNPE